MEDTNSDRQLLQDDNNNIPPALKELGEAIQEFLPKESSPQDSVTTMMTQQMDQVNKEGEVPTTTTTTTTMMQIPSLESPTPERLVVTEQQDMKRSFQDQFSFFFAVLPAFLAFFAWEDISHSLAIFVDRYGAIGRAVDGGQFTTNLLRPTITGIVVPVISIALATLVSTTVNVLRARQVELRTLVNKEACELRLLRRAVFGMFGTRQHAKRRAKALALMCGYTEQLSRECKVGAVTTLQDLQLSGGISVNELDQLAEMLHSVDGAAASRQGSVGSADGLIMSLNGHRSNRVALLLSVFPNIHWVTLTALSLTICFMFLLNSNQQVLQYLNSIQLRTLFAILVGVFSGTATLCFTLADPFRGSFSIAQAATQLEDLRICLRKDVAEACAEDGEISSKVAMLLNGRAINDDITEEFTREDTTNSIVSSKGEGGGAAAARGSSSGGTGSLIQSSSPERKSRDDDLLRRRRYGLASTIYFHLLTGPLGSNARILGDIIAWVASFVSHMKRSVSSSVRRLWSRPRTRKGGRDASQPTI